MRVMVSSYEYDESVSIMEGLQLFFFFFNVFIYLFCPLSETLDLLC